jgi:hypothetical protein
MRRHALHVKQSLVPANVRQRQGVCLLHAETLDPACAWPSRNSVREGGKERAQNRQNRPRHSSPGEANSFHASPLAAFAAGSDRYGLEQVGRADGTRYDDDGRPGPLEAVMEVGVRLFAVEDDESQPLGQAQVVEGLLAAAVAVHIVAAPAEGPAQGLEVGDAVFDEQEREHGASRCVVASPEVRSKTSAGAPVLHMPLLFGKAHHAVPRQNYL